MEMMVEYGMQPIDVLRSATSVNADVFKINKTVGRISQDLFADILVVQGDPSKNIHDIRNVKLVMKNGIIYKNLF
jgi:imidazolonepropionase-like amidohydrolase